jgi:malate/lactate dehydrogenase
MKKILIYGCGRTGEAIVKNLKDVEILTYRGKEMEGCKSINSLEEGIDADYLIITLANGGPDFTLPTTWQMRDSELEKNFSAFYSLGNKLKDLKFSKKCIVVSNPADSFAKYLREYFNLDAEAFGHTLDVARYSQILGRSVDVAGFHGATVPLIKSDKIEDYLSLMQSSEKMVVDYVVKNGINYGATGKAFGEYFTGIQKGDHKIEYDLNSIEKRLYAQSLDKFIEQYSRLKRLQERITKK